jgi:hypothetical protein
MGRGLGRVLGVLAVAVAGVAGRPAEASAQGAGTRAFIHVDFGQMQPATKDFTQTIAVEAREELQRETHVYNIDTSPAFGGGGGVWFTPNFGVGVAVSRFTDDSPANVTLTIPHFFFFNSDITKSIDTAALKRTETGIHVNALVALPTSGRVAVTLSGGVSHVSITQEMVADYEIVETIVGFPDFSDDFDFIADSFQIDEEKASGIGYNVAADVTVFLSRLFGIGGTIRYTQANVDIPDKLEEFYNGANVSRTLKVGGLTVAGSIRVRF